LCILLQPHAEIPIVGLVCPCAWTPITAITCSLPLDTILPCTTHVFVRTNCFTVHHTCVCQDQLFHSAPHMCLSGPTVSQRAVPAVWELCVTILLITAQNIHGAWYPGPTSTFAMHHLYWVRMLACICLASWNMLEAAMCSTSLLVLVHDAPGLRERVVQVVILLALANVNHVIITTTTSEEVVPQASQNYQRHHT